MTPDTGPEEGSQKLVKSPVRLAIMLSLTIFTIEVLVMLLVLSVPGLVGWKAAFVDGALLVILVTPVLYTAAIIPMAALEKQVGSNCQNPPCSNGGLFRGFLLVLEHFHRLMTRMIWTS